MITLYRGARGRGKTLTMVKDAFSYFKLGYRIISNMILSFGEHMTSSEVLKLNRDSKLFNCVLVLDEIQMFFDSRNFSKQENKDFSNFVQQIRKRNVKILCTTQYINTVDLRLRQHIDILAYPKFEEKRNICLVWYIDLTMLENDLDDVKVSPTLVCYNAKPVYPLYDTYEMLK